MTFTVSPVDDDLYTAVKAFIVAALPVDPANVNQWQANRVSGPLGGTDASGTGYALMNIVTKTRLRTNVDLWEYANDPTTITREQAMRVEMQVDLYGPAAGDWAAIFTTLWRDEYGCLALAPNCQPLHADDPLFGDFTDAEDQYENRWIVRAILQYNPVVSTPSQFADIVVVTPIINVDVEYPPTE